MQNLKQIAEAWCPVITPFDEKNNIHFEFLEKHLNILEKSGIQNIIIMGSIGEFPLLTLKEKINFIKQANKLTKLNIFVNVSSNCIKEVLKLAEIANGEDYAGVIVLPPFYYCQSQQSLCEYFQQVGSSIYGNWLAYNFPDRTNADLNPTLVEQLSECIPNLIGIKDTVDCISHTRLIIQKIQRKNFKVFSGYDEYLLPNLMLGGSGVISGLTNIAPEIFHGILKAWTQKDFRKIQYYQNQINNLMQIYNFGGNFIETIKFCVFRRFGGENFYTRTSSNKFHKNELSAIENLVNHNIGIC